MEQGLIGQHRGRWDTDTLSTSVQLIRSPASYAEGFRISHSEQHQQCPVQARMSTHAVRHVHRRGRHPIMGDTNR